MGPMPQPRECHRSGSHMLAHTCTPLCALSVANFTLGSSHPHVGEQCYTGPESNCQFVIRLWVVTS